MSNKNNKLIQDAIFQVNLNAIAFQLLGFGEVKKLAPSKENLNKFRRQFDGHSLCGCFSCLELARNFVLSTPDLKEAVVEASMDELSLIK